MRLFRRSGLVGLIIAVLALSEAALAATPIANGLYQGKKVAWSVDSKKKSMSFSTTYCHGNQTVKFGAIKIKSSGKFSYTGSTDQNRHVVIRGKYVTSKKAKGSVTVKGCSAYSFTAKYQTSG